MRPQESGQLSSMPEDVRDTSDILARFAGRSFLRFIDVEPALDAYRHAKATNKPFIARESYALAAMGSGFFLPLGTGIRQSALGEIPIIGGIAQAVGGLIDVGAFGGFHLTLGLLGIAPWLGYRALVSSGTEILPDRKANKDVRRPHTRRLL